MTFCEDKDRNIVGDNTEMRDIWVKYISELLNNVRSKEEDQTDNTDEGNREEE